jgi:hypothetical protein
MTDSLLIEEDEDHYLEHKRQGRQIFREICQISWTAPFLYLPLFWLLERLCGIHFEQKDWLKFAFAVPVLGCLMGFSVSAASHFKSRCHLTARGIKFGPPNFTFLKWHRLKRWHIKEPSDTHHCPTLTFHRSAQRPLAIAISPQRDLQAIRDFISKYATSPEQSIDTDSPGLLTHRTWSSLILAKWIFFALALLAFRLPNPSMWSSCPLFFSIFFHFALEYGTGLHWRRIDQLRKEYAPRWLNTLSTVLALTSLLGFLAFPFLKTFIMTHSPGVKHLIGYLLVGGPAAWWISHMALSDIALSCWYERNKTRHGGGAD